MGRVLPSMDLYEVSTEVIRRVLVGISPIAVAWDASRVDGGNSVRSVGYQPSNNIGELEELDARDVLFPNFAACCQLLPQEISLYT